MSKRRTLESFILDSNRIHNNKYDYSKTIYVKAKEKVEIICPIHGSFFQTPNGHLNGSGCLYCAGNARSIKEKFIERSNRKHNNKYDYSLVEYKNKDIKIKIICLEHGIFEIRPNDHVRGQGCKRCGWNKTSKLITKTTEQFIDRSNKKHNNKYDYSLTKYTGTDNKVIIICPIHGKFEQIAGNHAFGAGCPECSRSTIGDHSRLNNQIFIDRSTKVHGDTYDYSLVDYKNKDTKVEIICPIKNHGIFRQTPGSHFSGAGCPKCAREKDRSKNEIYCFEILEKIYPYLRFIPNDREVLRGKGSNGYDLEIDIRVQDYYYQDLLYIEWNGSYWHRKHNDKDELKRNLLGSKLIQIIDMNNILNKSFVESVIYEQIVPRLGPPHDYDHEDISEYFK